MKILRLGIFSSHGGSNLQAIIDASKNGKLNAKVCVVISNNSKSLALQRANKEGIRSYHLSSIEYPKDDDLDEVILHTLENNSVDIVVLAGYMKKLGKKVLERYKGKIVNIHPSLLPKYGGKGMYGKYVHEAVLKAGEKKTGVTIHLVEQDYDKGPIISQCEVDVLENDTIETLSERVLKREHEFYTEILQKICCGEILMG